MRRKSLTILVALLAVMGLIAGVALAAPPARTPDVYVGMADAVVLRGSDVYAWNLGFVNFRTDPLTFGVVNPATGQVEGGDYIGYLDIDIGQAPVSMSVWYYDEQGVRRIQSVTAAQPRFTTYFAMDGGIPWSLAPILSRSAGYALTVRGSAASGAAEGDYGDVKVRVALVTSTDDKVHRALGATHTVTYQVRSENDPGQLLGGEFMTVGGAK